MRKNLTDGWFFDKLPDMNTENPIVAQYLIQNSIWWAETSGLDGYRIDTFPYVSRPFGRNGIRNCGGFTHICPPLGKCFIRTRRSRPFLPAAARGGTALTRTAQHRSIFRSTLCCAMCS